MAGVVAVLRSALFYLVFHLGTVVCVLATLAAMPLGQRVLSRPVRGWASRHRLCVRWLLGIRVEIEGTLPAGDVLVAIKHESFFEAIDMPCLLRDPVVFAKAELLRIPLWGKAARVYGLIPVEREQGASTLRAMIAAARKLEGQGRPLVIFPEGTRTPHGSEPPLQSGFAALYKLLALPVVPVAVNSRTLYHRRWKRPGTITYRFGETIPAGLPRAEAEARVHAAINALNR